MIRVKERYELSTKENYVHVVLNCLLKHFLKWQSMENYKRKWMWWKCEPHIEVENLQEISKIKPELSSITGFSLLNLYFIGQARVCNSNFVPAIYMGEPTSNLTRKAIPLFVTDKGNIKYFFSKLTLQLLIHKKR